MQSTVADKESFNSLWICNALNEHLVDNCSEQIITNNTLCVKCKILSMLYNMSCSALITKVDVPNCTLQ